MGILNILFDLLFPPSCLACGRLDYHVCPQCLDHIIHKPALYPLQWRDLGREDRRTVLLEPLDGMVSLWRYRGTFQTVWKEVKYRHYYGAIEPLVENYLSQLENIPFNPFLDYLKTLPIVIPIPLHYRRQRWRGFNQATLIARQLGKHWQLRLSEKILERHSVTSPQAELKKDQRLLNMQSRFRPTRAVLNLGALPLKGKSVLLVDDIWTTGATMRAAGAVIKQLGAEQIWGLVLASG